MARASWRELTGETGVIVKDTGKLVNLCGGAMVHVTSGTQKGVNWWFGDESWLEPIKE